jgi:hypothetical protein
VWVLVAGSLGIIALAALAGWFARRSGTVVRWPHRGRTGRWRGVNRSGHAGARGNVTPRSPDPTGSPDPGSRAYEITGINPISEDGYRRTFAFKRDDGSIHFLLHVWYENAAKERMVGFQFATYGESGSLLNWRINGHPALTASSFSRGHPGYFDAPTDFHGLDISFTARRYLKHLEENQIEPVVTEAIARVLAPFAHEEDG